MSGGARQLKVGLRVNDLDRSVALYTKVGFRQIPVDGQPMLRYLTYGHTWLILSSLHSHGYHNAGREQLGRVSQIRSLRR